MDRRRFCQLAGGAASASWMRGWSQETQNASIAQGFNQYTQDYAKFCALSPEERRYYKVSGKQIVAEKLDNATWKATEWGSPAPLPIAGPSWDGVPLESPLPNLAGDGPYKPTWDSLQQYEAPEWYQDAKFGIWAHWSPQCVPEAGDWYARNMYVPGSGQYKYQLDHYGPQDRFGYKELCTQWTLENWEPEALIGATRKRAREFSLHSRITTTASIRGIQSISRGTRR
jgi:alpha-L-fucosidase